MDKISIEALKNTLAQNLVVVSFKKKNGELRVMTCTNNMSFVPPSKWPRDKAHLSEETKERTIRVYDTKAQDWRSFLFDNVLEYTTFVPQPQGE